MGIEKLFPVIETPAYGIFPGKTQSDTPIIGFVGRYFILVVNFTADGKMLDYVSDPWEYPVIEKPGGGLWDSHDHEREYEIVRQTLLDYDFASFEEVRVKRFWINDFATGVTQYPLYLQDVLDETEREYDFVEISRLPEYERIVLQVKRQRDEEELTDLREQLQGWRDSGDFVLHFGNDYWCDETGYIHSS